MHDDDRHSTICIDKFKKNNEEQINILTDRVTWSGSSESPAV